jgi:hypothetical protein
VSKSLILVVLVVVVLLAGAATYATADTAIIYGTGGASKTASDTVTVRATLNPKLTLTVVTPAASQTVDFGAVNPGTAYGPTAVNVTVQSNRPYDVSKVITGAGPINLTTTLGPSSANARTAGQLFVDNYSINVPWTTDPSAYTATVQYTVIQN